MVHWRTHTGELHDTGNGGHMEADQEWRPVSLDRQDCQVHQAGAQYEHDALSGEYEHISSRTMSDDRSSFSQVENITMTIWRSIISLINFKDETMRHQHLEHPPSLDYKQ
eukprot:6068297-Heterocapsa_arctica.AAC.1